jgi:hypothetical protein
MLWYVVLSTELVKLPPFKWRSDLLVKSCKGILKLLLFARTIIDKIEQKFDLDIGWSCDSYCGFFLHQSGFALAKIKFNQKRLPSEVGERCWIQFVLSSTRWGLVKMQEDVHMPFSGSLLVGQLIYDIRNHPSFWKEVTRRWLDIFGVWFRQ